MSKNISKTEVAQIWGMLDNLSTRDPTAYKKFINEQIEIGMKETAPPVPRLMIKLKNWKREIIYVVICSWTKIPKSEKDAPINLVVGDSYEVKDEDERLVHQFMVAFSDDAAASLCASELVRADLDLVDSALDCLHSQKPTTVPDSSTDYEICTETHLGTDLDRLYAAFHHEKFCPEQKMREVLATPDDVDELTNGVVLSGGNEGEGLGQLVLPGSGAPTTIQKTGKLVEEAVSVRETNTGLRLEARVGSSISVDDMELDMSEDRLRLEIPKEELFEPIEMKFQKNINLKTVTSKYLKKRGILRICAEFI